MDRFFLLLSGSLDTDLQQVSWCFLPDRKSLKKSHPVFPVEVSRGSGSLEDFARIYRENFEGVKILTIISGQYITYTNVALAVKNQRQMLQALPFLVEEQIIGNIEDMHIATQGKFFGDSIPIAIIEKAFIDRLKNIFDHYHLPMDDLYGMPDLLGANENELQILFYDDYALVKGCGNCFQCDQENLETILELVSWGDIIAINISLHELNKASLSLAKRIKTKFTTQALKVTSTVFTENLLDYLLRDDPVANQNPLNLLQGEFSSSGSASQKFREFAPVAWVFVLCLILQIVFNVASGFYFSRFSDQLQRDATVQYLRLFPDEKKVVNLEAQLKGKINSSNISAKGSKFTAMFSSTVSVMAKIGTKDDTHLKQFRYDEESGVLKIGLEASSIALLDKIKNNLAEIGLAVEIVSANEENGIIKATLSIKHL